MFYLSTQHTKWVSFKQQFLSSYTLFQVLLICFTMVYSILHPKNTNHMPLEIIYFWTLYRIGPNVTHKLLKIYLKIQPCQMHFFLNFYSCCHIILKITQNMAVIRLYIWVPSKHGLIKQYIVYSTATTETELNQKWNSQKTPYTSPSWVNFGVSFLRIWLKIDVKMAPQCTMIIK